MSENNEYLNDEVLFSLMTVCYKYRKVNDLEKIPSLHITNGNWAEWTKWSSCDITCGNMTQTRRRTCTNPAPNHYGKNCTGPETDIQTCVLQTRVARMAHIQLVWNYRAFIQKSKAYFKASNVPKLCAHSFTVDGVDGNLGVFVQFPVALVCNTGIELVPTQRLLCLEITVLAILTVIRYALYSNAKIVIGRPGVNGANVT
ncbi:CADN-like protein [Mya arenaria]|uniref:CADN-like protein n=1 Tax=Mya arenaria TaxID=6604 RepID=A0ABY7EAE9_MYAAR|nr:CADN-like protein [Mya arenaria]